MAKRRGTRRDPALVVAPGGPRPKSSVRQVRAGAVVTPADLASGMAGDPHALTLTPGGFRPRSLVRAVEQDQVLTMAGGRMRVMDRALRRIIAEPAVDLSRRVVPDLGSGWIAYAYWNNGTGSSITSFRTAWRVPPPPASGTSQTIFLFNGIQNYGMNYGILQPVLQWGVSAAGGGAYWSIANWYVTSGGAAFHSPLARVNPGDRVVGVMRLAGQSGSTFNYTSEFEGQPATLLSIQGIAELLWCNETLEAYDIDQCSNYPNTQRTTFESIQIQTGTSVPPVSWTPVNAVTDCGQHVRVVGNSGSDGQVDIHYRRERSRFEDIADSYAEVVTDPVLLWLFRHGWEDPGWGRRDAGQVILTAAIHELAERLTDADARRAVQKEAARALKQLAVRMEQER